MKPVGALRCSWLLCLVTVLGTGEIPAADGAKGSVTGTVVDKDGPLPGVVVEISGGPLSEAKSAITDIAGHYQFKELSPGSYAIRAVLSDSSPVTLPPVKIASGKETKAPVISMNLETVEVEAKAEDETKKDTTTAGETFSTEKLDDLPTGNSYTEVLKIAPGVSEDEGSGGLSVYGSTGQESTYIVDGINTTSVDSGRAATDIRVDLIDKIELKTAGYEAEFGGAQGAVVQVTTKSGTNTFAGSFAYTYSPDSLVADAETNGYGTKLPLNDGKELAASVGGPIVKDKLFFFAGLSRRNNSQVADQLFLNLLGDTVRTARTVAEDTDSADLYSLKLTWQASQKNRLTATFLSDPRTQSLRDELGGYGGDHELTTGGNSLSLIDTAVLGNRFILESQIGTHAESADTLPTLEIRESNPIGPDRRFSYQSIRVRLENGPTVPGEPSLKVGPYAYSGDTDGDRRFARVSLVGNLGHHAPKFGLEYETSDFHQDLNYGWGTGMTLDWAPATRPGSTQPDEIVGVRRCWGDGQGNCLDWSHQVKADATTGSWRLFAQDQWKPSTDLTINYGLRYETQSVQDLQGQTLIDIKNNVAPRFGMTWDVLGGGKSKLYFSAGRYYDVVPMQVVSRAFSPRITMTRLYRTRNWPYLDFINSFYADPSNSHGGLCATNTPQDDAGDFQNTTCWDFESADLVLDPTKTRGLVDKVHSPYGLLNGGEPRGLFQPEVVINAGSLYRAPVDPNLKGSSSDEAILGYEWEVGDGWLLGARNIARRLNSAIEDMSLDFGKTYVIENPGGPYRFYVDPANTDMVNPNYEPGSTDPAKQPGLAQKAGCAPGTVCTLGNSDLVRMGYGGFPKATRNFKGYELTLARSLRKNFWFNFSYLRSKTSGNYRGRYFADTEERDPNLTEAFDFPALVVNNDGLLPQDHTDQVKLYGNYRVTPSFNVGTTVRYASGSPRNATTDPTGGSTPFLGPIFLLKRGSVGRTPSTTNLDLSLGYDIRDASKLKLSLYLDVFNTLNSQKPVQVDDQFLASGMWKGAYYSPSPDPDPAQSFGYLYQGRGEPYDLYIDTKFGNHDGIVTPDEWNRWASSFQGAFGSIQELYAFLKHETVNVNLYGTNYNAPAYPGFRDCPEQYPTDPASCPAMNASFGQAKQLEVPRTIRLGVKLTF